MADAQTVLAEIASTVTAGIIAVDGRSGAGKSTFMRILAGLLEPTSGAVQLDGKDALAEPGWLRERLGYLPQDFGFYAHLNGRDMLLRSILNVLHERELKHGRKVTPGRCECAIMTSNRYLSEVVARSPETLQAFAGESPAGTWQLIVSTGPPFPEYGGRINALSIQACGAGDPVKCRPVTVCGVKKRASAACVTEPFF